MVTYSFHKHNTRTFIYTEDICTESIQLKMSWKMRNISSFISGGNFNKHKKQDQKGRGRGASRDRAKGQVTSTTGRGKPSGKFRKEDLHNYLSQTN